MRISDWSSDVCSSDLTERRCTAFSGALSVARVVSVDVSVYGVQNAHGGLYGAHYVRLAGSVSNLLDPAALDGDRKSVVEGKSVSVRVDLGGRRVLINNSIDINNRKQDHSTIVN